MRLTDHERLELEALRAYVKADDAASDALSSDRYADSVHTQQLLEKRRNARARMQEHLSVTQPKRK